MGKLLFVTATGLDDRTDLGRIADLSARFDVEWGVLLSPGAQDIHNRFPSFSTIERVQGLGIRLAAHLCGQHAKQIMKGEFDRTSLPLDGFQRLQVNHLRPVPSMISAIAGPGQTMIAQWRDASAFPAEDEGVSWLFDKSGGRGIVPASWPTNPGDGVVGFAGGISPANILDVHRAASAAAPTGFWLDFEGGARTDDWFDLDLVEAALAAIHGHDHHA